MESNKKESGYQSYKKGGPKRYEYEEEKKDTYKQESYREEQQDWYSGGPGYKGGRHEQQEEDWRSYGQGYPGGQSGRTKNFNTQKSQYQTNKKQQLYEQGKYDKSQSFKQPPPYKQQQDYYGGRGGKGYAEGSQSSFGKKPYPGKGVEEQKQLALGPQQVSLVTNQFKISFDKSKLFGNSQIAAGSKYTIHLYSIHMVPETREAQMRMKDVFQQIEDKLKMTYSQYLFSGNNFFSPTMVPNPTEFQNIILSSQGQPKNEKQQQSQTYSVTLKYVSSFDLENIQSSSMDQNPIQLAFINILIQKMMRSGSLIQVGRQPRFFKQADKQTLDIQGIGSIEFWPGFKASSQIYNSGIFIAIESINKFFKRQPCLEKIDEMLSRNYSQADIDEFFQRTQVMTGWGKKRPYKVTKVRMDLTPKLSTFNVDGHKVTLFNYYKEKYNIDLDPRQPLLEVGSRQDPILLPPQICFVESVPEALRKRKDFFNQFRKDPQQKIDSVSEVIGEVAQNKELEEWGVSINREAFNLLSRTMKLPQLINGSTQRSGKLQEITGKFAFTQQILEPIHLKEEQWAIVYDNYDYTNANYLNGIFQTASAKIGLRVADPYWVEVPKNSPPQLFSKIIKDNQKDFVDGKITVIVVLLPEFSFYPVIKRALDQIGIISQLVLRNSVNKARNKQASQQFALSLASELLKQINAKSGGDLYHVTLPEMNYKHTMLVGMDVCHAGFKSIVGFCATLNKHYSKYFSQVYYQHKGKEIGNKAELSQCYDQAFNEYERVNRAYPEHIIIFRDGVSDAQRHQVIGEELKTLKEVIKTKMKLWSPKITLVIVNKRINQRFFQNSGEMIRNPPAGTIIDTEVVQSDSQTKCYDFFLISQTTTQGCVLPVHFFVSYDDSDLSKDTLQILTYNLCYFYFNWSGAIKVPAPCQYAHKVAKYTLDIQAMPQQQDNLYFL